MRKTLKFSFFCIAVLALLGSVQLGAAADFKEAAKLLAADGTTDDRFGTSVAVDGDTAVIGASTASDKGDSSGSAYIFVRDGSGNWTQQAKLLPNDGAIFDRFGISVAVFGDTAIIGSFGDDDNGDDSGSAYIYVRSGTTWTQQAKLLPGDGSSRNYFGRSVAVFGDTAVIGAFEAGFFSGSAYIFVHDGSGSWTQQAKLLPDDGAFFGRFGTSVAVDAATALIGASTASDNGDNSGSAYVYVRSGTTWTRQAKLLPSDGAAFDQFGTEVAISGDTAIIGAPFDDDSGNASGSAYIFVHEGSGSWTQQAKLLAGDGATGDAFGTSVAVDSGTAVIGALNDGDNGVNSGSAYIYVRSGTSWTQQTKLLVGDGAAFDNFGISAALSGDTAIIGAFGDDDNGVESGSAYVFTPNPAIVATEALITTIIGLNLQQGINNALDAKLDALVLVLDDVNQNNDGAAFAMLIAFIQNVEAQRGMQLTDAQADELVAAAEAIIALL